jgi:hypothetical protein
MDMPPCDVLAIVMPEIGDLFHIDGESRPKDSCEPELTRYARKRLVCPQHRLQIFKAAA